MEDIPANQMYKEINRLKAMLETKEQIIEIMNKEYKEVVEEAKYIRIQLQKVLEQNRLN